MAGGVMVLSLTINFDERKARQFCLSPQPACHALKGGKTKSCEIEALRAGGGRVEITCSAGACAA